MFLKKICVYLLLILVSSLSIVGCSKVTGVKEDNMPANGIIRISPSSLFEGDAKKLEPHLGLISGCVKVKYNGSKKYMNATYEIWEEGKIKNSSHLMGTSIEKNYDGEISMSLKNESPDDTKQFYRVTVATNGAATTKIVPDIVIPDAGRSPRNINKAIDISDDKEIAVWGYVAQKGNSYYQDEESIEESAKKANWAFVIKISMNDEGLK